MTSRARAFNVSSSSGVNRRGTRSMTHGVPKRVAGGRLERRPGVETDIWELGDEPVAGESGIVGGILHHHDIGRIPDGMGAKRQVAMRLRHIQTNRRLEPLAVSIDERHERDRRIEEFRRQKGDVIERRLA
jgi:hypothetical protein